MAENKPTLHHLNNSQSQVILWLLEELEIPYNLELYERQTSGADKNRAPESMKKIHPLGKSPTLVTPEGRVIIERSAIALYLIDKYDTQGRFKGDPSTGNDAIRDDMLTNFGGASLNVIMMISMTFEILKQMSPFFIKPITASLNYLMNRALLTKEREAMFTFLEQELGDQEFFMGSSLGRADFMLMWNVDFCNQLHFVDLSKYPKVKKWYEKCQARDGWKRSMEKGNGYVMKFM